MLPCVRVGKAEFDRERLGCSARGGRAKVERNTVTYSAATGACEERRDSPRAAEPLCEAMELLGAMGQAQVGPGTISYHAGLSACEVRSSKWS